MIGVRAYLASGTACGAVRLLWIHEEDAQDR